MTALADEPSSVQPHVAQRRLILHVRTVSEQGGGPEKTILNSPRFYEEFGYRALCVYLHPPNGDVVPWLRRRSAQSKAHVLPIVDRGPWDVGLISRLTAVCRRLGVQLWHSHDYKSNALGLAVRRFHRMSLVSTVHGWVKHTARTPLYHAVDKWCLPWFDQVVCVSDDLYDECLRLGIPQAKCTLIHNGIDIEQAQRRLSRAEAKAQLHAPPSEPLIGAVGRLSAEKGFDKLIEAVVTLRRQGQAAHLWIAGEGDARPELESLINRLDCRSFVRLLGQVNDTATFYQAMDLFVLSSYREGLPNVLLEAMAYGAPVVATRIAGIPSLVRDGMDGLLVEPGQSDTLAAAAGKLLVDARLAESLSKSARARIESDFSFRDRTRKVCEVHDRALTGRGHEL